MVGLAITQIVTEFNADIYSGSQLHTPHLEGHDIIVPLRNPALLYSIQLRTVIFTWLGAFA